MGEVPVVNYLFSNLFNTLKILYKKSHIVSVKADKFMTSFHGEKIMKSYCAFKLQNTLQVQLHLEEHSKPFGREVPKTDIVQL